jgi:hypothetical protein
VRIFGREPAWWISAVQATLILLLMATPWSDELKGALTGLITLLGGAALAATVSAEKVLPLVAGIAQGVFAVALALAHPVGDNVQQLILGLISIYIGSYVRDRVVAPVVMLDSRRPDPGQYQSPASKVA